MLFDIRSEALRIYGTDLTLIPGVSSGVMGVLLTEIGDAATFREKFPTGKSFASWLGLCPDNRVSGGKKLGSKTRKVKNRVANQLRMAAMCTWRSDTPMGDYCRRMKARLGKAEGITATAHKMARIIYALITTGQTYDPSAVTKVTDSMRNRRLKNLRKQAEKLGMQLVAA